MLSDPTAAPSSHNPKLPRAFDHIVGKALAKDPADRYQDADEMARELRHFDTIELPSAAPSPLPALEHPTVPNSAPADELTPPAEEAPLASDTDVVPPTTAPWWRRPWAIGASALGVLVVVGLVAAMASRDRPAATAPAPADSARAVSTSGTIAAAPAAEVTPPPTPPEKAAAPPAPSAPPVPSKAPDANVAAASTAAVSPTPAVPKPTGRVMFAVTPWGELYVDGRKRGISPPMQELRVAPGKHVIEIRNTTFPAYRDTIDVAADDVVRIKHKFQ